MSKAGYVQNPMRLTCLADLLARCEPVGDCLEWQGRMHNGSPCAVVHNREVRARRYMWEHTDGGPIPTGLSPVPAVCSNAKCLERSHFKLLTPKQISRRAVKAGAFNTPQRLAAITNGARKRHDGKLSMEKAREIRAMDSAAAAAKKFHINPSMAARIRAGTAWREVANGASVFGWSPTS